jgi:hypothetical protein
MATRDYGLLSLTTVRHRRTHHYSCWRKTIAERICCRVGMLLGWYQLSRMHDDAQQEAQCVAQDVPLATFDLESRPGHAINQSREQFPCRTLPGH